MYDDFVTDKNFYHYKDLNLETDEWPMAAMNQDSFNDKKPWPPRNSLRCIPEVQNGSESILFWRHGYNTDALLL